MMHRLYLATSWQMLNPTSVLPTSLSYMKVLDRYEKSILTIPNSRATQSRKNRTIQVTTTGGILLLQLKLIQAQEVDRSVYSSLVKEIRHLMSP